jgi:uncharacterized tellurite resistance protein B-like protein
MRQPTKLAPMFRSIRRLFDPVTAEAGANSAHERKQLQLAVAVLLHEARRADYDEGSEESSAAGEALVDLFGLESREAVELLADGRARAQQLHSLYAPLATIKRDFGPAERVRLVEHLWRITFVDGQLNLYEDHYVRKIAHLLYVPNTDNMLARNRAREILQAAGST